MAGHAAYLFAWRAVTDGAADCRMPEAVGCLVSMHACGLNANFSK
jgi:hypothetical protein